MVIDVMMEVGFVLWVESVEEFAAGYVASFELFQGVF